MKKYIAILLTGLMLATGCKKNMLNLTPYTAISSTNAWTTDNLTDLGMAGVYQALRLGQNTSGDSGEEPYMMDQLGFSTQARTLPNLLNGSSTSNDGIYADFWRNLYEGVQRANDAITNIPAKSQSDPAKKARYIAEAKFLRAYFYTKLNQLYKGVPIYLTYTLPTQATKARSTETDVWNQVIADLTDAINEPNLPAIYKAGDPNYGHATKGAAYALRGKAYLYLKKYDLAAADFQQVANEGYALYPSYYSLFKQANQQCSEMIFAIQNVAVVGAGGTMEFFCGNRTSYGSCWDDYLVPPNEVDLYQNLDGSTFNWDDVIPGYNELTPAQREVYFLRDNLTTTEITAATKRGAMMSLYLPVGNEARIAQAYANRDPRLAVSVITPYSTYNGVLGTTNATLTWRWPYRGSTTYNDVQSDMTANAVYLHRKFVAEGNAEIPTTGGRNAQPLNFPLIRYADVLLMWAEALNEEGQTDAAIPLVNQVRARAGVALLNSNAATTVNGQDDLRQRIRNERRVEFINEGINYYDELRWGTVYNVYANGGGTKEPWGTVLLPFTWQFGSSTSYVWPIPLAELQRNPNLKQTPGYGW